MKDAKPLTAEVSITSRFENIEVAERVLRDLCTAAGFSEDDASPLVSALWEALANAIRHGNRNDPRRRVHVALTIGGGVATIAVEDEGPGFDPDAVPDPTKPENLLRANGRGIFFMRQLMDRVEFSRRPDGGTLVTMERRLDA